ncbi:MAG TPA: carboxypeptidase regulatory-like domain-containing protein [Holophagaceae bacterium]|nr:carboxypeptidase regulatory-like domain-containing protein [Holophagaceae bacterium]
MSMRHLKGSALMALIVAAAPLAAQGVNVQLAGQVTDSNGQALADATVSIRNEETGFTRVVQTNGNGRYLAVNLPVGPYAVTVSKPGYQTASNIRQTLNLGDAAPLNVKLAAESVATVEVVAQAAPVDAERSTQAAIINPDALQNLPVFNRSFTSLATTAPQVITDNQRGNLAIAGQRGVNTAIQIDGGDVDEPFFGGQTGAAEGSTPFTISIEAVREYQVVTDGASAEYGRMGGGYVNAITKSGTNDFGGSVFFYTRPQSLISEEPSINGTQKKITDYKQNQFGFSVGGPIIKDKLFYFVVYDAQRYTSPITQIWGGQDHPLALNPANANDAALIAQGGDYDAKKDSDTAFGRIDWIVNANHTLQFRVNYSKYSGLTSAGTSTGYSNTASDDAKTLQGVIQWNWAINASWYNEAELNYVKEELPRHPHSTLPQVQISQTGSSTSYYGTYPFAREFETKRTQLKDTVSFVTATTQVKAGVDYNKTGVTETFAAFSAGGYTFTSLANFEAGNWSKYVQYFGLNGLTAQQAGTLDATEKELAAFVQFDQRVNEYLKYGLGLRWDRQEHPGFATLDFSNPLANPLPLSSKIPTDSGFSPRFSLTLTPGGESSKTVIRLNGGRYISRTPSVFIYQVFAANGIRGAQFSFTHPAGSGTTPLPYGTNFDAANPASFSSYPGGGTTLSPTVFSFDPEFKNPRTDRLSLGAERALGGWVLGLEWAAAHTVNLERIQDLNLGATVDNGYGRQNHVGPRPNTAYYQIMEYRSDAESWYHALTFSAKFHQEGSPFEAQLFYTRSTNKDNDSNERNFSSYSTQNTQDLGADWGYADTDRRDVVTGYVSYLERHTGIQFSTTVKYASGSPYSLTYGSDLNHDGVYGNDRFYVNGMDSGRNAYRNGSTTYVDLGLRRSFRFTRKLALTLSADVFNVFNDHNEYTYTTIDKTSSDAAPLLTTATTAPGLPSGRQVQLGARFSF